MLSSNIFWIFVLATGWLVLILLEVMLLGITKASLIASVLQLLLSPLFLVFGQSEDSTNNWSSVVKRTIARYRRRSAAVIWTVNIVLCAAALNRISHSSPHNASASRNMAPGMDTGSIPIPEDLSVAGPSKSLEKKSDPPRLGEPPPTSLVKEQIQDFKKLIVNVDSIGARINQLRTRAWLEPYNALRQVEIGNLCLAIGDRAGALEAFREALRADPTLADVREQVQRLEMR